MHQRGYLLEIILRKKKKKKSIKSRLKVSRDSDVGQQQPPKAMGMPCAMVTPEVLQHGGRSCSRWDRAGASPRGFLQPSTLLGGAGRLFSGWPGFNQSLSGKRWNRMFREGNKTCVPRGLRQRSVPRQERFVLSVEN